MAFKHISNYDRSCSFEPISDRVSRTVPDQALSVRQIFYRFDNGLPLDIAARRSYYDYEDVDSADSAVDERLPNDPDLVELWEIRAELEQQRAAYRASLERKERDERVEYLSWKKEKERAATAEQLSSDVGASATSSASAAP